MSVTTFSSRTFARDATAIKRAAARGPVFITDRGKPALAVLSIEAYYSLAGEQQAGSLLDAMLALPAAEGIALELGARAYGFDEGRVPDLNSASD